ncbi:MAG: ankyrin repeat domain-containing protein [Phycisphaerae bacterium]
MTSTQDAFDAIRSDDADRLKTLLANEPALAEARDAQGVSLLMQACYRQRPDLVELILPLRREPDVFEAAAIGRLEGVTQALDQSAEQVHAISPDGFTPLHLACYFGHEAIVHLLLKRGANSDAVSKNAMALQPLHSASVSGRRAIVRALLDHGADVNARQHGGWTPLHGAAASGDDVLIDMLLKAKADSTAVNDDGKSPADVAEQRNHKAAATALRSHTPT